MFRALYPDQVLMIGLRLVGRGLFGRELGAFFHCNGNMLAHLLCPCQADILSPNWLRIVAGKQNYLARLQVAIECLHGCEANHRETVPVREVFQGQTVWKGAVEVFDLYGHHQAGICYGWSRPEGNDDKGERFVTMLQIAPVTSPETAVRMSIYSGAQTRKITPSDE